MNPIGEYDIPVISVGQESKRPHNNYDITNTRNEAYKETPALPQGYSKLRKNWSIKVHQYENVFPLEQACTETEVAEIKSNMDFMCELNTPANMDESEMMDCRAYQQWDAGGSVLDNQTSENKAIGFENITN